MTDKQIERLIMEMIKERGITFYDMIGNERIDPEPWNTEKMNHERARQNRFNNNDPYDRILELLALHPYNKYASFPQLRVSLQDIFRFWWNHCVSRELVFDEILEDLYHYFLEMMRPQEEGVKVKDPAMDFDQLDLSMEDIPKAA